MKPDVFFFFLLIVHTYIHLKSQFEEILFQLVPTRRERLREREREKEKHRIFLLVDSSNGIVLELVLKY